MNTEGRIRITIKLCDKILNKFSLDRKMGYSRMMSDCPSDRESKKRKENKTKAIKGRNVRWYAWINPALQQHTMSFDVIISHYDSFGITLYVVVVFVIYLYVTGCKKLSSLRLSRRFIMHFNGQTLHFTRFFTTSPLLSPISVLLLVIKSLSQQYNRCAPETIHLFKTGKVRKQ